MFYDNVPFFFMSFNQRELEQPLKDNTYLISQRSKKPQKVCLAISVLCLICLELCLYVILLYV